MASADTTNGSAPAARESLLRATERLIQREKLDDLSVAQILKEAGVSRATFYFYFGSKDDAFLALLGDVIDDVVPQFEALLADPERRRSPTLRDDIANWLAMGGAHQAVMFNAIQEWPRRPDLQPVFLAGIERLEAAIAKAIDEDRAAGVAPDGPASEQLAAGVAWTIERVWLAAVSGTDDLSDVPVAMAALGDMVVAAIYGR